MSHGQATWPSTPSTWGTSPITSPSTPLTPPPPVPGQGLQAVVPPVHKVPHEDVVGIRWRTSTPEKLLQIIELAMDVPAHGDRGGDWLDVGLLQQQVTDLHQVAGDTSLHI